MARPKATFETSGPARPFAGRIVQAFIESTSAPVRLGLGILRLPFDAARAHYARAVQVGLIERSLLASRDFERALGALERFSLGPLARRV